MSEKMTKRERVEATLNFKETDRVPIYDIVLNDPIIEYFTGKVPKVGKEGVKVKCQALKKMVDMTRMVDFGPFEKGEIVREDGFVEIMNRWTLAGIKSRPFSDEKGAIEWIKSENKKLEKELQSMDIKNVRKDFHSNFKKLQEYIGDDTVILHDQNGTGLDNIRYLLGIELFTYVYEDEPDIISRYLELSTKKEVQKIHAIADSKLSPCALTYGDIAYKGSLLHSPKWLKKEFVPRIKRLVDAWHEHDVKCLFHSDGYLMEILPDLVEVGIDGLNPIESVAGMDLKEVKDKYGDKIFIAGTIDISQLLSNGTIDEVRKECEKAVEIGDRGFFLGSTTELDNGAKLENILTMLEVAWNEKVLTNRSKFL